MKKKLLLIYPKNCAVDYNDYKYIRYFVKKRGGLLNGGLGVIAALTPPEFDVKILDENIQDINFNEQCDIVGITGFPTQIVQAGKIAEEFRRRGVVVVCGGSSVSISGERWRHFSDVLIKGEAERIWPQFMDDYLSGSYKDEYCETEKFELTNTPIPDYSSVPSEIQNEYLGGIVQTSRGCPFDCEFCSVIIYAGRKMRYKTVDNVIQEVEQLYKMGIRFIFLADDNFSANKKISKNILKALRDWNKEKKIPMAFTTQLSIDIARDEEFLELAVSAGLKNVMIGLETPNVESLKEAGKHQNLKNDPIEEVKRFYEYGITVIGGSVVGFDNDDISIFQRQFDFYMQAGVPSVRVFPLQAPDGTRLKDRMIKEGRYVDWASDCGIEVEDRNSFNTFSIVPKQLTFEQLRLGTLWLIWELNKPLNISRRLKTFFEIYENSPKKGQLDMLESPLDRKVLKVIWRIFKYYFFRASKEEKVSLRKMVGYARNSSLPHRFSMVLSSFLTMKNTQGMVRTEEPNIEQIKYPE